ncbi:hypothetical protein ACTJJ4_17845 [Microbacterium sp. 22195]|uniref:hypothetical protein n=1 Tax=Microbacterium sp. 22195 TaxID=3453891 RepID=UPI003F83EC7F
MSKSQIVVPDSAPKVENYVMVQAVQASLGGIPEHALAVGVSTDGVQIVLHFQLSLLTESDMEDMEDMVSELGGLFDHVDVDLSYEIREERRISHSDGVCWIFLARH